MASEFSVVLRSKNEVGKKVRFLIGSSSARLLPAFVTEANQDDLLLTGSWKNCWQQVCQHYQQIFGLSLKEDNPVFAGSLLKSLWVHHHGSPFIPWSRSLHARVKEQKRIEDQARIPRPPLTLLPQGTRKIPHSKTGRKAA